MVGGKFYLTSIFHLSFQWFCEQYLCKRTPMFCESARFLGVTQYCKTTLSFLEECNSFMREKMQYFCDRTEMFCKKTQNFSEEYNTFARERIQWTQMFWERTQNFLGECNTFVKEGEIQIMRTTFTRERIQRFSGKRKSFKKECNTFKFIRGMLFFCKRMSAILSGKSTNVLRQNAVFFRKKQMLCERTKHFLGESKTFVKGCKIS